MRDGNAPARRVVVEEEPPVGMGRYDYADAFEVRLREPDAHSAEEWARAALEHSPWAARWMVVFAWRALLRFRLGPPSSPTHILGGKILASQPDMIQLELSSPLMRGVIVGRRVEPPAVVATTFVFYRRAAAARIIWVIVSPLHRRLAPYLLAHAAATLTGMASAANL